MTDQLTASRGRRVIVRCVTNQPCCDICMFKFIVSAYHSYVYQPSLFNSHLRRSFSQKLLSSHPLLLSTSQKSHSSLLRNTRMTEPADSTMQSKSKKNGWKRFAKGDSGDKLSLSGKGGGNPTRLRGMDTDSPGVRLSKTLSWILRHGALSEGILMRPDGFVKVEDIVGITPFLLG